MNLPALFKFRDATYRRADGSGRPAIVHRSLSIDPLIFITAILSAFILSMLAMIVFTLIFRSRRGGAG